MTSISTSAFYDRSAGSLASLRARAETLQTQIATGERLQRGSDDPVAARGLRALAREEGLAAVHKNNAALADADLALAEGALTQLSSLTIRAQELATQSATGTLNTAQRQMNGDELAQIHASMVAILNSKDTSGNSLFAGTADGPAYSVSADGRASYVGTSESGEIDVGSGIKVARGLTGPEVVSFSVDGADTNLLTVVHDLASVLRSDAAGAAGAASQALGALGSGLAALSTAQAVIAARQGRVELAASLAVERGEIRAEEQKRLGETDLPTAIAQLQQTMTVLEASQATFTRLSGLSLFDYLR